MDFFTRMSLAALMVPFIQCQGEVGDSDSEVVSAESPLVVSWYLTGAVTPTAVSGFSYVGGHIHRHGTATATLTGVYALLSRERNNDPCEVSVGAENLNTQTTDFVYTAPHCGSSGPTSSTMHADYLDINAGGSDDHNFIRGVNVCMDSGDDKVKGISVAGLRLNSNGTTSLVAAISDTRTNCHHWAGWVMCPAGQIATAVDSYFLDIGGTPYDLTGLSLHCKEVTN